MSDEIARRLVEARLRARPLPEFPGRLPETLEHAYAIQSASIKRWPDRVAGWKIAKLSPAQREQFGAERLVGPVFQSAIHRLAPGVGATVPVIDAGFAAVEAEYALELGAQIQPRSGDYSDEELATKVAAVYAAAEIASSPLVQVNQIGAMAVISDLGINAGLVVGPRIADWRSVQPGDVSIAVTVDGASVGNASPDAIMGDPLRALRSLVEFASPRSIVLPAGALISTGAMTGVHDVHPSSSARLEFGRFGGFDVNFEAAKSSD